VVLLIVAAVAAIGLCAPYLLSTSPGRAAILHVVNGRIDGRVEADTLRLTWSGPCKVGGLRVWDAQGRQIATVGSASVAGGLLHLAGDTRAFGKVTVNSVNADVHLSEPQSPDSGPLAALRRVVEAARDATAGGLPRAVGTVELRDSRVRITQPDGRQVDLDGVVGDVEIDLPAKASAKAAFALPGGRTVRAEMSFTGASPAAGDGAGLPVARLSLATDGPADLSPLGGFLGAEALSGAASLVAEASLKDGRLAVRAESDLHQVTWTNLSGEAARPLDAQFAANVAIGDRLEGAASLTGDAGTTDVDFSCPLDARVGSAGAAEAVSRMLAARPSGLPEFTAKLNASVDLPALGDALPALLAMLGDAQVSAGSLAIEDLDVGGGDWPRARGHVRLDGLVATSGDETISPQPMDASFDVSSAEGTGVSVNQLQVDAGSAWLKGGGHAGSINIDGRADLAGMKAGLGAVFQAAVDLPDAVLSFQAGVDASDLDRPRIRAAVQAEEVSGIVGGRPMHIPRAALTCTGYVAVSSGSPVEAAIETGRLTVAEAFDGQFTAGYAFADGAFHANISDAGGDIEALRALLPWIADEDIRPVAGGYEISADLAGGAGLAVTSSGRLAVDELTVDGKAVADGRAQAEWSEAAFEPGASALSVHQASLAVTGGHLAATDLRIGGGPPAGHLAVDADLAPMAAIARAFKPTHVPADVRGRLVWQGDASPAGQDVRLKGRASVTGLKITRADGAFAQQSVVVDHDVVLAPGDQRATLDAFRLTCDALSLDLAGTILGPEHDWTFDLSGRYAGDWRDLLALAEGVAPGLSRRVSLSQRSAGSFTVKGPARDPNASPSFAGLVVRTDNGSAIDWQTGELLGFALGEGRVRAELVNGVVEIPMSTIPAGDAGKLRVVGSVDFTRGEPVYLLPGRVTVIEDIPVTSQVSHDLLSRFNPIFAQLVDVDGRMSLTVADLAVPLGKSLKTGGRGGGHLDLSNLRVRPRGMLAELLASGAGDDGRTPMQVRGVDFILSDGRIHYDRFGLVFADDFELQFYGSVGFDDTLDLAVSVPVSPRLLDEMGVRGPVADYARVLAGMRIAIPVTGSRLAPRLDFSQVDIAAMIEQAGKGLLSERAGQLLEGAVRPGGAAPRRNGQPATQPAGRDEQLEPLLDSLMKLLGGAEQ
jgi:hypothetical protein